MAKQRDAADRWKVPSQHQKGYAFERVDTRIKHPPSNWMKLLVIDPGTTRLGLLFAAVPGPPQGDDLTRYKPRHIHIYGEAMLYNSYAMRAAPIVKEAMQGWLFEDIIIDKKGSDPRVGGMISSIREHWETEFKRAGIFTRNGGSSMVLGSPDVAARESRLKEWMHGDDPILKIHRHCTNLENQLKDFFRSKEDHTKRENNKKKPLELIHTAEYLAGYFDGDLWYHSPEPAPKEEDTSQRKIERLVELGEKTGWQPFAPWQRDPANPNEFFGLNGGG